MEKKILAALQDKSHDERLSYFNDNKDQILSGIELATVNGGALAKGAKKNPNSEECPFEGNWVSSFGYVCDGVVIC